MWGITATGIFLGVALRIENEIVDGDYDVVPVIQHAEGL